MNVLEPCNRKISILMVDDDPDDCEIAMEELLKHPQVSQVNMVSDGVEMFNYLKREESSPDLILLDLQMPRMDGRQALEKLKSNPRLKNIPTVVFTTSQAEEDIERCYSLGANTYIQKPRSYVKLMETMKEIGNYWGGAACLPNGAGA